MSSTRSIIAPPPFAANALTVIPPTPVAGVSYRDPVAGPASSPDGWSYAERVNSAEWNQIMYQISSLVSLIDKKGILGWSSLVDYTESGICFGSDGQIYSWVAASGPNNGGAKDPISQPAFWSSLFSGVPLGIVGQPVRWRMNVASANASASFTADQVIVQNSLSGSSFRLSNFSKVINLATTGAGGMDVGTASANGFVGLYAIYNPSTQVSALLATMESSALLPNIYGGANMPAGFTHSALVSICPIHSVAGQFAPFVQFDRNIRRTGMNILSGSSATGAAIARTTLTTIPYSATYAQGFNQAGSGASGAVSQIIYPTSGGNVGGEHNATTIGAGSSQAVPFKVPVTTPLNLYQGASVAAGTGSFTINISGYDF